MNYIKVKSTWLAESGIRLDASYHLSDGPLTKLKLKKSPYTVSLLSKETKQVFKGNIFKRVYVSNDENGYQFMTASDMMKSDIKGGKYISKKYTNTANLILDKDWILVSRSGTLGNTVYTNEDFVGIVGTDDLIRVIPNNKNVLSGYLYSYLTSKYGYGLLTQSGYGAVVKHIEPHHILNLPIPIFPKLKQKEIHDLVNEAANLKVQANKALKDIQSDLLDNCGLNKLNKDDYEYYGTYASGREARAYSINISDLSSDSFKALNYSKRLNEIKNKLESSVKTEPLKEVLDEYGIWHSSAFKRVELKEGGIELLSQKDIFKFHISGKKISKIYPKESDIAKKNEILISGVGSNGEGDALCRTVLVKDSVEGKVLAGEFLRMNAKSIPYGYLFSWLNSDLVYRLLRSFGTGTTLIRPIESFVREIPVPILDKECMLDIHNRTNLALENIELSRRKEMRAIDLVEKEIESWQE